MTAPVQMAPAAGAKTQWKLDPTHTTVEFSAKHLMITTVKATCNFPIRGGRRGTTSGG